MQTLHRHLIRLVIPLLALVVACGGGDASSAEDQLRADVKAAFESVFGEEVQDAQGFRVVVSVDDFIDWELHEDFAPYEVTLPAP